MISRVQDSSTKWNIPHLNAYPSESHIQWDFLLENALNFIHSYHLYILWTKHIIKINNNIIKSWKTTQDAQNRNGARQHRLRWFPMALEPTLRPLEPPEWNFNIGAHWHKVNEFLEWYLAPDNTILHLWQHRVPRAKMLPSLKMWTSTQRPSFTAQCHGRKCHESGSLTCSIAQIDTFYCFLWFK